MACLLGMPNTPVDVTFAMRLRHELVSWAFSEIDFENKSCRVLPTASSAPGVSFTGTSGFPMAAAPHDPFHSTLAFAKDFLAKIDSLPSSERAHLGLVAAVIAVDTIYTNDASEFTTTYLPGLAVTEQNSKKLRELFLNLSALLGTEKVSSVILATEQFWVKAKIHDQRFEEVEIEKIKAVKFLSDELKKERLFLLDVTPKIFENVFHLSAR